MREKNIKRVFLCCLTALAVNTYAQNFNWVSSTEGNTWKQSKVKLQSSAGQTPLLDISGTEEGTTFKAWGTTFNELCWDALNMLTRDEQDDLLKNNLLLLAWKHVECIPSKFIKACSPGLEDSSILRTIDLK